MDNLDVETIEQIQDHDQLSITDSGDEIVSILDTEPDGTADCVHQGHLTDRFSCQNLGFTKIHATLLKKRIGHSLAVNQSEIK